MAQVTDEDRERALRWIKRLTEGWCCGECEHQTKDERQDCVAPEESDCPPQTRAAMAEIKDIQAETRERVLEEAAKWHGGKVIEGQHEITSFQLQRESMKEEHARARRDAHADSALHFRSLKTPPVESPAPTQEAKGCDPYRSVLRNDD